MNSPTASASTRSASYHAELVNAVDDSRPGVSADELAERAHRSYCRALSPHELRRWLVAERLAVDVAGLLHPTRRAFELGFGLR